MTDPLFRNDAYLRECRSIVTAIDENGGIILDRSVFYPTGGGQPGDRGELIWGGGSTSIATTIKGQLPQEIVHIAKEGFALPPVGAEVTASIDWETRFRFMRIHTALHLLSVVVPLPVTGGSIGPDKGRLDFDMPDAPEDKEGLEIALNKLIEGNHPVTDEWISDAELSANPNLVKTMAVKPPMGHGRVRLVRIGSADQETIDLQPCGGTHVRSTSEIGHIRIGKIEKKGRQNRRVSIHID